MTIEDKLKTMIVTKYGTMLDFSRVVGIPNSTLANILKRGVLNAGIENIIKICEALNISVDALACGKIEKAERRETDEKDVGKILGDVLLLIASDEAYFEGVKLSKSEAFFVKNGVKIALEGVREERSET